MFSSRSKWWIHCTCYGFRNMADNIIWTWCSCHFLSPAVQVRPKASTNSEYLKTSRAYKPRTAKADKIFLCEFCHQNKFRVSRHNGVWRTRDIHWNILSYIVILDMSTFIHQHGETQSTESTNTQTQAPPPHTHNIKAIKHTNNHRLLLASAAKWLSMQCLCLDMVLQLIYFYS